MSTENGYTKILACPHSLNVSTKIEKKGREMTSLTIYKQYTQYATGRKNETPERSMGMATYPGRNRQNVPLRLFRM